MKLKLEIVFSMQSLIQHAQLQTRTKLCPKTNVTLLQSPLSQLSAPCQHHPPTVKALQTTKITKLSLVFLPSMVCKVNIHPALPGKGLGTPRLNSFVLTIRVLI